MAKIMLNERRALIIFKNEAHIQIKKYNHNTGKNFLKVKQIEFLNAKKAFKNAFVLISHANAGAVNKNRKLKIVIANIKLSCQPYIINNLSTDRVFM